MDNFYQNLSSQHITEKCNCDRMTAPYNKVYVRGSELDKKLVTLSEAYVVNNHLFIKG